MENKLFNQIWDQLRIKKSQYAQYLDQVRLENIRGIIDLSINFNYPVSVIAGANASGKSTVLHVCACAYEEVMDDRRLLTPDSLFPILSAFQEFTPDGISRQVKFGLNDTNSNTVFEFYFSTEKRRTHLRIESGNNWKKISAPKRQVYLRTFADLTGIAEARKETPNIESINMQEITSDLIAFAQRILPLQYHKVSLIKKGKMELLFAERSDVNGKYSEFHMSAGERAILRISKDISNLKNALVLIDEVEVGLHPFTQQQLMLELQRIALRNDLQIIVTSHSPVVIDSVPPEARIFLERTSDNVIERPAYKDIIQKALYGQSTEKLNLLCEDEMGEYFILGLLDYLNPKLNIVHDDIKVGRDTGKEEFPQHIVALGKFNKLSEFIFVLDGDARELEPKLKTAGAPYGVDIKPLFLPGNEIPESWAWKTLSLSYPAYSDLFGLSSLDLNQKIIQANQLFDNATDKESNKNKNKFHSLCEQLRRDKTEIIRAISRNEIEKQVGDIKIFGDELELQIRNWQSRK